MAMERFVGKVSCAFFCLGYLDIAATVSQFTALTQLLEKFGEIHNKYLSRCITGSFSFSHCCRFFSLKICRANNLCG